MSAPERSPPPRLTWRPRSRLCSEHDLGLPGGYVEHNLGYLKAQVGDVPSALRHYDAAADRYVQFGLLHPSLLLDRAGVFLSVRLLDEARRRLPGRDRHLPRCEARRPPPGCAADDVDGRVAPGGQRQGCVHRPRCRRGVPASRPPAVARACSFRRDPGADRDRPVPRQPRAGCPDRRRPGRRRVDGAGPRGEGAGGSDGPAPGPPGGRPRPSDAGEQGARRRDRRTRGPGPGWPRRCCGGRTDGAPRRCRPCEQGCGSSRTTRRPSAPPSSGRT